MSPKCNPHLPYCICVSGEHMEEDEKESDEIEINVGGDRGGGRRRENRRERTEQDTTDFHKEGGLFM